jgi:hypothetical protein
VLPAVAGGAAGAVVLCAAAAAVLAARRRRDRAKLARFKGEVSALRDAQKEAAASQRQLQQLLAENSALRAASSSAPASAAAASSANPMHAGGSARQMSFRVPDTGAAHASDAAGADGLAAAHAAMARAPSLKRAFSVTKIAEPPLAAGWVEVSSSKGTPYWRHSTSGATSWSRPSTASSTENASASSEAKAEAEAKAGLPEGWAAVYSKTRQTWYWRHEGRGETTWEKPSSPSSSSSSPLPPDWAEKFSASKNRPYWYKVADPTSTSWERPTQPA